MELHSKPKGSHPANELGVYIHLPYCRHRCSYCDFFSAVDGNQDSMRKIGSKIAHDIEAAFRWYAREFGGEPRIRSVFFGGGTPSLFPIDVFTGIFEKLGVLDEAEVTTEANPETVTEEWLQQLRDTTAVNRVSLGVQSFHQKFLDVLDRRVNADSIFSAVKKLHFAGISNFSLDLIFGIPGQTSRDLSQEVARVRDLSPRHVSYYQLTLKPGHPLFSTLPSDDECADFYEQVVSELEDAGYAQYEISNFSQPGFESRHNLLYWAGGSYFGFGPSASSRIFYGGECFHRKEPSDMQKFFDELSAYSWEKFERNRPEETVLEGAFLELRKNSGVDLSDFSARFGYAIEKSRNYRRFLEGGLLEREGNILRLSSKGRMLADNVARDLVDL